MQQSWPPGATDALLEYQQTLCGQSQWLPIQVLIKAIAA